MGSLPEMIKLVEKDTTKNRHIEYNRFQGNEKCLHFLSNYDA